MKVVSSIIFAVSILLITSCSNHNDASYITNPMMGKADINPSTVDADIFPYPYLNEFSKVNEFKVHSESPNSIKITLESHNPFKRHYYVVIEYYPTTFSDVPVTVMYYVEELYENSMDISGVNEDNLANVFVYTFETNNTQEIQYPFYNKEQFGKVTNMKYDVIKDDIYIKGSFVNKIKTLFLHIEGKETSRLIYLGRPVADEIALKKYGANGVVDIKLFAQFVYTEEGSFNRF